MSDMKLIMEAWRKLLEEERRAGDYVDPDDPDSGYIRTKKGVEPIMTIPRPDDELAIPGMNPEEEEKLTTGIIKRQKERGFEDYSSEEQFLNFWEIYGKEHNMNPVSSFLFKIPNTKGAPKDYSWGNFAIDVAILASTMLPAAHVLNVFARAGSSVKAAAVAKASTPQARALMYATAAKAPAIFSAVATQITKAAGSKAAQKLAPVAAAGIEAGVAKVIEKSTKAGLHTVVDDIEAGDRVAMPMSKKYMSLMVDYAKKKGQLDKLKADPGFMAALKDIKAG